jgi:hypothetical protein
VGTFVHSWNAASLATKITIVAVGLLFLALYAYMGVTGYRWARQEGQSGPRAVLAGMADALRMVLGMRPTPVREAMEAAKKKATLQGDPSIARLKPTQSSARAMRSDRRNLTSTGERAPNPQQPPPAQ